MGTFERLVAVIERMSDRLEVMGDQIRANTQAILRALARLDGPPGESAWKPGRSIGRRGPITLADRLTGYKPWCS
jgi:hypothetical protein